MSLGLEWMYNPCLGCDTQTEGAAYCSDSCRLSEYEKTLASIHCSSSPSMRITSSSSTSPAQEVGASVKAEKELRAYNMSLDQSKMRRGHRSESRNISTLFTFRLKGRE
ncbi:hypothetical protein BGZ61DRAFT_151000 [Ilyonectria robusta]|uniref:uncharacterized protein n=1 Tax=Ilyonectria robusta TaxID=1079257 RepID=UPI001E8D8353|nr:uncharacterized protein BGZ61DRAFT_151000 [Ilyonectria robusta]KAH8661127.1 hypothetical protein BGZ61DRAFT_151000 [Ilyonectria robusta]